MRATEALADSPLGSLSWRVLAVDIAAGAAGPGTGPVIHFPKWSEHVRVGAAALLLVCLVLPFSMCSYGVDEEGVASVWSKKPEVEIRHEHRYPWIMITRHKDWELLLAIIWPIPVLFCRRLARRRWQVFSILALEPVLVLSAALYIDFVSSFLVRPAIGAHLMLLAYGIYGLAWLAEIGASVRRRLQPHVKTGSSG